MSEVLKPVRRKNVNGWKNTESAHQIAYFHWVRLQAMKDWRYQNIFHVPNGGYRHARTAALMKASGVSAGVPDIIIAWPHSDWGVHGCFIELKRGKNRPTAEQNDWMNRLRRASYMVLVLYSSDELISHTEKYFIGADAGL